MYNKPFINRIRNQLLMMIVGTVSNASEAKEMEFIVKLFTVGNRARALAQKLDN